MNKHYFLFFILFINGCIVLAQSPVTYELFLSTGDLPGFDREKLKTQFQHSVKSDRDIDRFMHIFYEKGYLLAAYSKEAMDSGSVRIHLDPGRPFKWASLRQGNLPDDLFLRTGIKREIFSERIFNFRSVTILFRKVIEYSENHGYPFASIGLSNIKIEDNRIWAEIKYDPGTFVTIGGVSLTGNINIKPAFLEAFLDLRDGLPYDQRRIERIPQRIRQLAFLRLNGNPETVFSPDTCTVVLGLEPVRANSFDGIIGFLPNENKPDKLLVTGQLYLGLENLFRSGKRLNLEWQKPNLLMQELNLNYGHPALLRSPLDLAMDFHLFKQDTSFIDRELGIDLSFHPGRYGSLGLNYDYLSSRLLSTDFIQQEQELDQVDYDISYYGVQYRLNTLNSRNFPGKGFFINASVQFGNKKIIRNPSIGDDKYNDIKNKTFQVRTELRAEHYVSIAPRNVLMTRISAGFIDNERLFFNDLFRLGGLKSIRGFNERFFYASWYLTGTVEYRYQLEDDSRFILFFDGSGLGYNLSDQQLSDHPFGFGGGFSLATRAGMLEIIFAMGKSAGQSIGLDHSKIHIGYSSRF